MVIPLLKAFSANLRMFAKVVGLASMVQKKTSANDKPIIDCGNSGYVPTPIAGGSPSSTTGPAAKPAVSVNKPPAIGAPASTPTPEKLKTIAGDISELAKDIEDFQKAVAGGPTAANAATALGKLGEIITDIDKLGKDLAGGQDAPTGSGTTPPGAGVTPPGSTAPSTPPTTTPTPFDQQQIWNAVTSVLKELGILPPDASGGQPSPGPTSAGPEVIKADIDAVQTHLDKLRTDLGIAPYVAPTEPPSYSASDGATPTPTASAPSTPETYAASDTGLGTGGGTGGGSGGGSPSGGGSGGGTSGGAPEQAPAYADVTVIGHSYGSVVTGVADRDFKLNADKMFFIGSPGVGVDSAAELSVGAQNVYASTASNDIIRRTPSPGEMGRIGLSVLFPQLAPVLLPEALNPQNEAMRFGPSPSSTQFGGNVVPTIPGAGSERNAHSSYFATDNPAMIGIGQVITNAKR